MQLSVRVMSMYVFIGRHSIHSMCSQAGIVFTACVYRQAWCSQAGMCSQADMVFTGRHGVHSMCSQAGMGM